MGQVVQTNGDYTIKTAESGNIILDTGDNVGFVRVTGNLLVQGDNLTVSAEQLNVKDNIITLNFYTGDPGSEPAGVVLRYSGLQVDRGTLDPVSLLWDDVGKTWLLATGTAPGPFAYQDSRLRLKEILTSSDTDNGDLILIGDSSARGVVKVTGNLNYTTEIINRNDPDTLTNKGYVDFAIVNNPTFQITNSDSRVIVTDKEVAGSLTQFETITNGDYSTFGQSAISVLVDGVLNTQFYDNRVEMLGLEFNNSEITTKEGVTNQNILIRTQGTGKLETNYALQLENIAGTPSYVNNSVIVYGKSPDVGNTGFYFVHQQEDGEFISKNKALVFSMIF
jgi:hypothetical protein